MKFLLSTLSMLAMASSSLAFVQPTLPAQVSDEEYLAYKAIVTLHGSISVISCTFCPLLL